MQKVQTDKFKILLFGNTYISGTLEIGCAWSKGSGERLQGYHGPLVYQCCIFGKRIIIWIVNPLSNDKIFGKSKLEAFADNKINANQKLQFALGRVVNIVGKEENAGYQHFLLFPQCFKKHTFSGSLKVEIVW